MAVVPRGRFISKQESPLDDVGRLQRGAEEIRVEHPRFPIRKRSVMRKVLTGVFVVVLSAVPMMMAQDAAAPVGASADKPRVYVTDSNSWQMTGSSNGAMVGGTGAFSSSSTGGARPQTAEIIKTFGQRCPQVIINNRAEMADYVVELEHEGGKGLLQHKDKVATFVRKTGDSIFSESTLSVGGSVQDACKAILTHWGAHAKELQAMPSPVAPGTQTVVVAAPVAVAKVSINVTSTPAGADITINGGFVGNTPSLVEVDPGENVVVLSKKGYADWTRTVKVKGGTINLNAELEAK